LVTTLVSYGTKNTMKKCLGVVVGAAGSL